MINARLLYTEEKQLNQTGIGENVPEEMKLKL